MKTNFFHQKREGISLLAPQRKIILKILKAFDLIRHIDHKEYKRLFSRLNCIFITRRTGTTNEFFMPEKIWFANRSLIEKNNISWIASLIIHEAFHATQFKNGKYIMPLDKLESPALKVQAKFLKKIEGDRGIADIKKSKENVYWKQMANDTKSYSYFRNLLSFLKTKKINLIKF